MTPELLAELGRGYRLRHTVQRRIEYGLLICVFGAVVEVVQRLSTDLNLRPLTLGILVVAVIVAASAWPVALEYQKSVRKVRWLRAQQERKHRLLPNAPEPFDTPPPGAKKAPRRAAYR